MKKEWIIDFVKKNGQIRLICSPALTKNDIEEITKGGRTAEQIVSDKVINDIELLINTKSENYESVILATLIKIGSLKIKIAVLTNGDGIYHEKLGIFKDNKGNSVSFIGSANETLNAWHEHGNFESIEVFCSWKGEREKNRVTRHIVDFENLWNGNSVGVKSIELKDAIRDKIISIAENSLDEINFQKFWFIERWINIVLIQLFFNNIFLFMIIINKLNDIQISHCVLIIN